VQREIGSCEEFWCTCAPNNNKKNKKKQIFSLRDAGFLSIHRIKHLINTLMSSSSCRIAALLAITLLSSGIINAATTLEATKEELALIQYVKDNGGMVNIL
jgi:hypothetical protein